MAGPSLNQNRSARGQTEAEALIVPSGGLTINDLINLAAPFVVFLVVALIAFHFFGTRPALWFYPRLAILAAVIAGGFLAAEEISLVRRIELTADGVTFFYPVHREHCQWSRLEPSPHPLRMGNWAVSRKSSHRGGGRAYVLALSQARALLAYPACPRWVLSPKVAASLGIPEIEPPG